MIRIYIHTISYSDFNSLLCLPSHMIVMNSIIVCVTRPQLIFLLICCDLNLQRIPYTRTLQHFKSVIVFCHPYLADPICDYKKFVWNTAPVERSVDLSCEKFILVCHDSSAKNTQIFYNILNL